MKYDAKFFDQHEKRKTLFFIMSIGSSTTVETMVQSGRLFFIN